MTVQQPKTESSMQPAPSEAQPSPVHDLNVNNLGYFLDGWADLVEGMGEKAEEVRLKTLTGLKERTMPEIEVSDQIGFVAEFGKERRRYTITQTTPGATTTIYIGKHGKDLYTSWRTFIKPVPNWVTIIVAAVIAIFIGFFVSEMRSFWIFLTTTFIMLIFEAGLIAIAGRITKGNFMANFFIEPTVFDAEDITAMSLSAHKSLVRALDNAGIDVTKLRLKQNFKGGRRGEDL